LPNDGLGVVIKQIGPGDRLTGLSLGNPAFTPLKTFLQKHAQKYEAQSLARTYGAFYENTGKIIAYVTLVCGEVVTDDSAEDLLQEPGLDYSYRHYPAVKIARLAVDQRVAGNRIGTTLVNLALGQAKRIICPTVGCRFVVVDSKRESVPFYEKCGFTMLDTDDNKNRLAPVMWIDLNKTHVD
jgi:GNAT superfamily N-acetyltransferase